MFTDVSIDLETLGTALGSTITQIGLCAFNQRPRSGGENTMSATLIHVDPQKMIDLGFGVDWSTVKWWLQQDEGARQGMVSQQGHDLQHALFRVGDWFAEHCGPDKKTYRVWGHGCGFDCSMLEFAYQKLGMPVPWDFRQVRDLRTLADLTPAQPVSRPLPTQAHNAMDDATAQARWIQDLTYQIEKRNVGLITEQPQG